MPWLAKALLLALKTKRWAKMATEDAVLRSSAGNSIRSIGISHSAYVAWCRFAATVGR